MGQLCYTMGMATITLEVPDELLARLDDGTGRLPVLLRYWLELIFLPADSSGTQGSSAWNEIAAFLARQPDAQTLLNFRFSAGRQERFVKFLKNRDKTELTPSEESDIHVDFQALSFLSYLKTYIHYSVS